MSDEPACNCYRPWSGGRYPIKEPCPVHGTTSGSSADEAWKCPACRRSCPPWKRCPYCPGIEASPSRETGRCGDPAPRLTLGGEVVGSPVHCRLPAGHDGWHRGDDRSEWSAGDERVRYLADGYGITTEQETW